uniref:Uncharacterized protein n=1 Tax=Rhizophora mucronata TaxID=61149 RepID=A0A2P2NUC8_RHIMU
MWVVGLIVHLTLCCYVVKPIISVVGLLILCVCIFFFLN